LIIKIGKRQSLKLKTRNLEQREDLVLGKKLFKQNFIGPEQIKDCSLGFIFDDETPKIPYDLNKLNINFDDYILILGIDKISMIKENNIINLLSIYGYDGQTNFPGFYNQDWYINEPFAKKGLDYKWYLIKKTLNEQSRGLIPEEAIYNKLPSAILCTYSFFIYWHVNKFLLWEDVFVWCSDLDQSGDRVYVGKYSNEFNNNGFSIHRHLKIKNFHGIVEIF
tara:strand:+ start:10343 stop:11008 length:666 start_codon:yes stop_codon:yes gene_type:complete